MILFWLMIVGAYLLGSVPSGLLIGRWAAERDVRQHGSGNIGATNVLRTVGRGWGGVTLVADLLKGALPVFIVLLIWPERPGLSAWIGLAAVVGHCHSAYLGFKGGKGVATAMGVFLVFSAKATAVGAAVFALLVLLTRRVSLGSIFGILAAFIALWFFTGMGPALIAFGLLTALIILRHKDNIIRLLQGREGKLTFSRGKV